LLDVQGWLIQMCSLEIVLLSCGHGTCIEEAAIGPRRSSMLENVDQHGSGTPRGTVMTKRPNFITLNSI
jgi:hypothetical protein